MSTRIYDGVKFKSKDFKEILDQLTSIKSQCIEIGNNSFTKDRLELFITGNKLIDKDNRDIFNEIKGASTHPNPFHYSFNIPFQFSIVLYPTKEGDIYGYFFNSNINEYFKLLSPFVDEYEYYDDTDKPDHLTDEQWRARSEKWDELIPRRIGESGFTFNLVTIEDVDQWVIKRKIADVLPSLIRDNTINNVLK